MCFSWIVFQKCWVSLLEEIMNETFYLKDLFIISLIRGFPGSSDIKESACNAGDPGSIPGS